tara:strand:+ start:285 stop:554 length:270 start_codon:yes stop_codon:yes gene_type:complete
MKKIASFLPDNIINKSLLIKNLNQFIIENFPKSIVDGIEVINVKDNVVIMGCKNSSLATILKFERNKYLEILKKNSFSRVTDLKIVINN